MRSWIGGHAAALEIGKPVVDLFLNNYLAYLKKNELDLFSRKFGKNGRLQAQLESITFSDFDNMLNHKGVTTDFIAEATVGISFRKWNISTLLTAEIKGAELVVEKTLSGGVRQLGVNFPVGFDVDILFADLEGWRGWVLSKLIGPSINLGVWFASRIFGRLKFPLWDTGSCFDSFALHPKLGSPVLISQETDLPHSLVMGFNFEGVPCNGSPDELFSLVTKGNNMGTILNQNTVSSIMEFAYGKGWFPSDILHKNWEVKIYRAAVQYKKDQVITHGNLVAAKKKCWCRVKMKIRYKLGIKPVLIDTDTEKPKAELQYHANISMETTTPTLQVIWGILSFQSLYTSILSGYAVLGHLKLSDLMPMKIEPVLVGRNLTITASGINKNNPFPVKFGFPLELWSKSRLELGKFSTLNLSREVQLKSSLTPQSIFIQEGEFGFAVNLQNM